MFFLFFSVPQVQRDGEFSPIKNASGHGVKDSPATAAVELSQAQKKWLIDAGAVLDDGGGDDARDVEVGGVGVVRTVPLLQQQSLR